MTQTLTARELIKAKSAVYKPRIFWREIQWRDRSFFFSYWTETGLEKESILQAAIDFLLLHKYFISIDRGWSNWDLEIHRGVWSRAEVTVCTENHGGSKRLLRVRCAMRMSQLATMAMMAYLLLIVTGLILKMPQLAAAAVVMCAINTVAILYQNIRLGYVLSYVLMVVAKKLSLLPIHPNGL